MSWLARREGWDPQREDARDDASIDYGRVVHSASFRRLQGKTQILNLGDSDFYRTRLTHSLEVAQIAGGIVGQLRQDYPDHSACAYLPSLPMIQAIGFTHDLGHPPFGHGGEVALNYCMRDHGGFEGNGQTLRILSRLETFSKGAGANLTRRTMLGVLKYPVPYSRAANPALRPRLNPNTTAISIIDRALSKPPKCYLDSEQDVVDWILDTLSPSDRDRFGAMRPCDNRHNVPQHKSFDCSIMDLADDISFGIHDLEDALAIGIFSEQDFRRHIPEEACASFLTKLKEKYPGESRNNVYEEVVHSLFDRDSRKRTINRMVHHMITHCRIQACDDFQEPLIRYRVTLADGPALFLRTLRQAVGAVVIRSPNVQQLEFKGQRMVVSVFEAIASEPDAFLPIDDQDRLQRDDPMRVICDYIAGMTDAFLLKTYERMFSPRMGSVFDRL